MDDIWKRELWFKSYGTVFNLRKASFDAKKNPILYFISACFEKFIFNFTSVNENYLKAPIFENPCLPFDVNNNNFLKKSFFTDEEFALYKKGIHSLTVNNILNPDHSTKPKLEFELNTTS